MKVIIKMLKILFGSTLFIYSVCCMVVAPAFEPNFFSMNVIRVTELIMIYLAIHGISIIVWAVKNQEPIHDFRMEVSEEINENP